MSGRFPGATDNESLWKLLEQGQDMHRKVPKDRFDIDTHVDPSGKKVNASHTPYGCFIEEPGLFDARFFNMSPREATETDPMHRLALVTAYEALEQSGFVLNATPSTQQDRVGTFYGQTCDDWREVNAAQNIATYFIPGGVRAFAPGRISYYFGFRGPSYSVDTACSSSLAAIQIACSSLLAKECDTAVAGGLNILTAPDIFAGLSKGQFLSATGSCKTWDSLADGYCRADGIGSIILKREEDAINEKDNILGVILAAATNHSADAISITHPHAGNQSYLYEKVLHTAAIDPVEVSYVEMHGTGTQAGDVNEMQSVTDVFAPSKGDSRYGWCRDPEHPLHIGAVKSNVGHGEAAAGITALIKVLMMFQKNMIPPHVGIKSSYNPALPRLEDRNVHIPFHKTQWPRIDERPRTAFLNNFSAAGGNTALVLQDAAQKVPLLQVDPRSTFPFVVSSKSLSSLRNNIQQLIAYAQNASETTLASLSYTLTSRRMHHNYRVGVTASDLDGLRDALNAEAAKGEFTPIPSKSPTVAFVFTGQGAFYASLGRDLFEQSSLFRSEIIYLNELAITQGLPSFLPAIEGSVEQEHHLSMQVVHLALVCVQIALVTLWRSWGIKPSIVLGHSLGEYAALWAAGVLSKHDVIHLVGRRAKLLETNCQVGVYCMLAVRASVAKVQTLVKNLSYEIACINSPSDIVLSGGHEEMERITQQLTTAGIKCLKLDLPYAFHSQQIEPILEDFEFIAQGATFNRPTCPVISALLADTIQDEGVFNPSYLCRQARKPVLFAEALQQAFENGIIEPKTIFVEIGPHPICANMIKNTLETGTVIVASLHKAESPWTTLSKSLCRLHCTGSRVDWQEFHRDFASCHELLDLPAYSFDNKTYWIDYVNDWCLYKTESRQAKLAEPPKQVSKLSTSSVHRIVSQDFRGDTGTVIAQSDLSEPALQNAVLGHLVNGVGLCPSVSRCVRYHSRGNTNGSLQSIYADIALTLGDYVQKELNPSASHRNMNCSEMEVMKPLIVKQSSKDSQILQVTITVNLNEHRARLRYATIDARGEETIVHATCTVTYEDTDKWLADWSSTNYLITGRIETLKNRLANNKADQISRGLAYKLFAALVQYEKRYQGMEEVILDSQNFEATSRVEFQSEQKDGRFFFSPFWIDSLCHLSGFILNGSDAIDSRNFVYVSHGWKSMRFSRPLNGSVKHQSYVKMQPLPNNIMTGDVYVFEGNTIIGVVGGLKFQRIPRAMLDTILPPVGRAKSPNPRVSKPASPIEKHIRRPAKNTSQARRNASRSSKAQSSLASLKPRSASSDEDNLASRVLSIISQESELPMSELLDQCIFSDLGIDSLLSLQICGKIRESLEVEIQSTVFVDYQTVGELKQYLQSLDSSSGSLSTTTSVVFSSDENQDQESDSSLSSTHSQMSIAPHKGRSNTLRDTSNKKNERTMMFFRTTIAEQMGIALEEVQGSNDLISLGMDSLMSICILGILREQTDLELPPSLFIDHPSIEAIEKFLGFTKMVLPDPVKSQSSERKGTRAISSPSLSKVLPQAVSILMQGKPKTAKIKLFLFPDGSGSATSYASIPDIDPNVAVYGLNCPFMTKPFQWKNGISGVASIYLEEIRRRQPQGPYHIGGWSAGGIIAYEAMLQLHRSGERVENLVFLDSPCPIELEPLPSRLHKFLADVGILGSEGTEIPAWLLPHFEATIKALTDYKSAPHPEKILEPKVLAIWAKHGVCGQPGDPRPETWDDDPKSMKWLLENRTDFGANGWDRLLDVGNIETKSLEGNHFTLLKSGKSVSNLLDPNHRNSKTDDDAQLRKIAGHLREFLLR